MTNKPPRPITAEDLERLGEPLKSSLWPLKYASPTGRLPRPWPEIWRDRPHAKSGPQPAFLGADFGEIEARAVAAMHAGVIDEVAPIPKEAVKAIGCDFGQRPAQWVHVEYHGGVPRMYRSAWDDANPNPYYGYTFPHIRLMVLADNAITDSFVPYAAHCFNQAVRGGIVFG